MNELKKILVAFDGSPHSRKALDWALDLSRHYNAETHVVLVWGVLSETRNFGLMEGGPAWATLTDRMKEAQKEDIYMMEEVKLLAQAQKVKMVTAILEGDAAAVLIDYAKDHAIDLIIAGTRGHGTLDILLGSVTTKLINVAPVPVLVVKG